MRILAHIHAYPPLHNAGAEWMQHAIFKFLVKRGHQCTVMASSIENGEFEGVKLVKENFRIIESTYKENDIIISYLGTLGKAINLCKLLDKPLVAILHNTFDTILKYKINNYLVYNSKWASDYYQMKQKSIIVRPPIWYDDYFIKRNEHQREAITMINLNDNKGGRQFIEVAKKMPDRKFIGVIGKYGDQIIDRSIKNIEYVDNTNNIKAIYAKTRILLMLSEYESYGRTAVEACVNGIPVISNHTLGLKEAMGYAAMFAPRKNIDEICHTIKLLDNKDVYEKQSDLCRNRAAQLHLESIEELINFEEFMQSIINKEI